MRDAKAYKVFQGTLKVRLLKGLNQISWEPSPWRTIQQPAAFNSRASSG